jgi:hypothetical protein
VTWDLLVELSSLSSGKEEAPEAYFTYVEEADDDANKVSQRKRIGMSYWLMQPLLQVNDE